MATQLPRYHVEPSPDPVAEGRGTKIVVARKLLKIWDSRDKPHYQHHSITFPCLPSTYVSSGLVSLSLFSSQLKIANWS